jgi:ABC-type polysaccharide/polyol phosphate export permease
MLGKIRRLCRLLPPLLLREIKESYASSAMGVFWTILQPLLFILLFWLVFSQIMQIRIHAETGDIPFIAFLLSGLLPWLALQEGIIKGASSIVDKRQIIKKVMFPVELFPISSALSSFIHHGIGMAIFLLVFFIWNGGVSLLQILIILILLLFQILLTIGLSLIFSSLTAYIRDIPQLLGLLVQALFYMSTILFPFTSVPEKLRSVISINPATSFAESFHNIILYGKFPDTGHLTYIISLTGVSLAGGIYLFSKLKRGFADVL